MKNNGKVRDVRSLACKIKVLNGFVRGTWKWTIHSNNMQYKWKIRITLSSDFTLKTYPLYFHSFKQKLCHKA